MTSSVVVTNHAVVRWIERHDGIDLSEVRAAVGGGSGRDVDAAILAALAAGGIDPHAVRRRILTPAVLLAVRSGACSVRVGGVRLVIADGRIITVRRPEWDGEACRRYGATRARASKEAAAHAADRRSLLNAREALQDL